MKTTTTYLGWCILGLLAVSPVMAVETDDAEFDKAEVAVQAGDLGEMQSAYERILMRSPKNVRALNGRATSLAWQGKYRDAQKAYETALIVDNDNIEALIGLGYAYAWDGQFVEAHTQFQRALKVDPVNLGARKGIGYSFYWQGENELSLGAFQMAASLSPNDAEVEEAIGTVTRDLGRTRDAIPHFDKALALDPDRKSALLAKRAAYVSAPTLEVSSRFGSTSNAGTGIRQIEIAHWPERSTRIAVRYDNSLGLDNPSISQRGADAPGYFGSVQRTFSERYLLAAEIGSRDLVDDRQTVFLLQGTYFAPFGALRLGVQQGRSKSGQNDSLTFAGINFPVSERWRVEPMAYLSETGINNDREWRLVVGVDYISDNVWQVGAFLGGGEVDSAESRFKGNTTTAGLRGSYLIADKYSLTWGLRRDEDPISNFTVAEIGFTYRFISN